MGAHMESKLSFDQYHKLGEEVSRQLDGHISYAKIGAQIGLTKQRAWHIAMVALGKVAYQLKLTYSDSF